jgi:hypothetical protein
MSFLCFAHAHIFLFFIVVCIHLRCYTTSDVHLIMCIIWKETIENFIEPKNEGYNIIFNVFLMYFFG